MHIEWAIMNRILLRGLDATVFVPSVDLKFKNDTGNYILIQTYIDPNVLRLTFELYGTKDGREVTIGKPVVTNESPRHLMFIRMTRLLPKGQIKQVDFAARGQSLFYKTGNKKWKSNYIRQI